MWPVPPGWRTTALLDPDTTPGIREDPEFLLSAKPWRGNLPPEVSATAP